MKRMSLLFIKSAGVLLLITAAAKFYTAFGHAVILDVPDPVLRVRFGRELLVAAVLETVIGSYCVLTQRTSLQLGLIAWLSTGFAAYRFGLWAADIHICKCLGNVPAMLHLSTKAANTITLLILTYLLLGSYGVLLAKWLKSATAS